MNCTDDKKKQRILDRLKSLELSESTMKQELPIYISFLSYKTKTKCTPGVEVESLNNSDSLVNYFTLDIVQDSLDTNHEDLPKEKIAELIAIDLKPILESHSIFQGISIVWNTESEIAGGVGTGVEITYKQLLKDIPEGSKFKYKTINDTLSFEDYYYNGTQAYSGKIFDKRREGFWQYWYSNGVKKKEGSFSKDEKVGTWKYWDEKGEEQ